MIFKFEIKALPLLALLHRLNSRRHDFSFDLKSELLYLHLFLLLLLLPLPVMAGEISGYAEAKGFAYAERWPGRDNRGLGWGTLFTKWEEMLGETQFTASLRGEGITSGEQQGVLDFDPADRRLRRSPVSVRDLWLRIPLNSTHDLQLGRFQLGWGKTDGYSPADAFLPRDLTDPFADEKLPLWALRLNGYNGALRYEVVASPVTTPWRLPPLGSRNAPIHAGSFPSGTVFNEVASSPPDIGFAAVRLQSAFGDWEVGGWGRAGVRPAPLLEFRIDQAISTTTGFSIPVERRYAREEAVGIELSRIIGSWIVRGEGAALFSRDCDLGNALIGSLSAERGFGDGTFLITLAGNAISPPVDASQLFDRAILPAVIAAWNRTEEWGEWKLVWSAGLKHGDGMLKGEAGYNISDIWKLTLGGELPYGSEEGVYGALNTARRVHVALRRSW
ncbi:MAG: hypothetical protein PHF56_06420 [Desulfuromonadaceae bacterium]|nr:hypothetical protein [Desulfuromonadaceae bacterium]